MKKIPNEIIVSIINFLKHIDYTKYYHLCKKFNIKNSLCKTRIEQFECIYILIPKINCIIEKNYGILNKTNMSLYVILNVDMTQKIIKIEKKFTCYISSKVEPICMMIIGKNKDIMVYQHRMYIR